MFDVQHERAADSLANLLQLYYPKGCRIIDFTFGTGALWWKVFETPGLSKKYRVTACDAVPFKTNKAKSPPHFVVHRRNVNRDEYSDLGRHDVGLVDFPYRIAKPTGSGTKRGNITAVQLQGPRSWARNEITRFMYNKNALEFNERVSALNLKAPQALKPSALLINKIMSVSNGKGGLAAHPYECWKLLTNFELAEDMIYVRHDTGPFRRNGNLERIHGHFQIYRLI